MIGGLLNMAEILVLDSAMEPKTARRLADDAFAKGSGLPNTHWTEWTALVDNMAFLGYLEKAGSGLLISRKGEEMLALSKKWHSAMLRR